MVAQNLIKSPINYMGSKYVILPKLIPLFPTKGIKTFYDLFTGGGSVYMNVAQLYPEVIANDILEPIVNIHRELNGMNSLSFVMKAAALSKETKTDSAKYAELRDSYNSTKDPAALLALIWSCNSNMMRFNKKLKFNSTWGKRCYNENTEKRLQALPREKYGNVCFTKKHFTDFLHNFDKDCFVYLDPPYSNTEAGYNALWEKQDDEKLIAVLSILITKDIPFGISGVLNGKENPIFNFLKYYNLKFHYFGDLYTKISKKEKVNKEYYITNVA